MRKIFITLLLISFLLKGNATNSLGTQVTNAKFQIIKSTVEFLATDAETFGNIKDAKCTCKSYDDLRKFAADNKLLKVPDLVNEWKLMPVDTVQNWKADLLKLKNAILKKIASGEKEKRKKIKGYDTYVKGLDEVINGIRVTGNNTQGDTKNIITPNDTSGADTSPVSNEENSQALTQDKEPDTSATENNQAPALISDSQNVASSGSPVFLYAVIVLLGILCAWLFYKNVQDKNDFEKKLSEKNKSSSNNEGNKIKITSLEKEITRMNTKIEKLEQELILEKSKVTKLETEKRQAVEKPSAGIQETKFSRQIEEPVPASPLPSKEENKIFYARYADLGDGFSTSDLLTEPDGEAIFEINIIAPGQAKYRISKNNAAQKYALSNASYFLGKTCRYDIAPGNSTVIKTETDGDLKLQGNKWAIANAAKISFS